VASVRRCLCGVNIALALRGWEITQDSFGIPFVDDIRILDIVFQKRVAGSTHDMWFTVIKNRESVTHTNYLQKLCLIHRDQFECQYLFSLLWYCTQVLPITSKAVRQINTMIVRFIWKGNTCRIPLSTLHLPRQKSGLGLLDISAKFNNLFINPYRINVENRVSS